uniref:Proteoglycan 4a n=1 Tax=Myripristis murdjan TaxID=586833 RepID=A0A668AM75_9TELE
SVPFQIICVGRCGEVFTRGQQCACDSSCLLHNECCKDFDAVSQSCRGRCAESFRRGRLCECDPDCIRYSTCCHDYQLHCGTANIHNHSSNNTNIQNRSPASVGQRFKITGMVLGSTLPGHGALPLGSSSPQSPSGPGVSAGKVNIQLYKCVCVCVCLLGEHFWSVDPVSRSVSSPQSITDTLGVPAPIDTVFTRCNCQGNTYIIKGDQLWRLDGNMMVEPGYPQPLAFEFSGLTGGISAALPLPATRGRPETVYFFKGGDTMQRYMFPPGSAPSCSRKSRTSYTSRTARQAEGVLSGEINLKVSLKGFPTPVTCALSMPNPQRSEGYEHYVFSGPLFFNIKISGDLPALAKPHPSAAFTAPPTLPHAAQATNADGSSMMAAQNASPPHPANSIMRWLQCP